MTVAGTDVPRRVLIISAAMGDGHDAAATALSELMETSWRGCTIERLDTMELRGSAFAKAVQRSYNLQLSLVPWSYELSYAWFSRSARSAQAARALAGEFFGRRLAKVIAAKEPDLVVSTYPFGSAALDWLKRKKDLSVPIVTYVPAFHVSPLWVYRGVDLHLVMYGTAADDALLPGCEASVRVAAPPVRAGFGAFGRGEAREMLGLPATDFVVLMSGGAWGLGNIARGAAALLRLEPPVHVVAVCGRNAGLESEMRSLAAAPGLAGSLTVYGYVSTMPQMMAAADVVVTNGAGMTVLEALWTPRPVVAFAPLAGHGTASTAEMVRRDLALEARDVGGLVAQLRRLRSDPVLLGRMQNAAELWGEGLSLQQSVDEIAALYRKRSQDRPRLVAS
jgi:UDP-N-acetylglucosamine:LPS N-acetylglucosamine transferase